ncbi:hypothetical protein BY996DRAFT_6413432 [Phakopsora pachyrhizi]|uniref:Secreted protein n=2 Tax=Phakopsora pachyrhizi TaxID=170000 RepID=A0AAV0BMJ7_PHAPC|nr:hypothetical protein BY996DRAFT_8528135 [Phakopsora pachyrhizi]KAI8451678.1 hypothetical protein BY996DRAFT_7278145 [Phakopsora pachyrhizi]KAI8455043.1 hypothetical protein BY996DRAFT_6413431 [Phakopsora pachyrhizi]KAI8455044.1 hypothetical protein BY996DRAFT_6413432 [Phakopsora pachyrhizi]CAH7686797.1 hypothetical protein PPACK8108_LOCUS21492 [Phakopsora pachyrhizi]
MLGKSSRAFVFPCALLATATLLTQSMILQPRRFGQQNPTLPSFADGCPGEICARLAGGAPGTLLAAADPCAAQDLADTFITESKTNSKITTQAAKDSMVQFAQALASAEKNTPPDFTQNPPTPRNALFCTKQPTNSELQGFFVTQDPANGPNEFFDPATKSTVLLGAPGTQPPGPRAN